MPYSRSITPGCSLVFLTEPMSDGYIHKHCCSTCSNSEGRQHKRRCQHFPWWMGNEQGYWWRVPSWMGNEQGNWWTDEEWRAWYSARALSMERRIAVQQQNAHSEQLMLADLEVSS
jgi:hypothetical protein